MELTHEERIELLEWKIQNFKDDLLRYEEKLSQLQETCAGGQDATSHQT